MDENQQNIKDLLSLLDDPDERIWYPIRDTIFKKGKLALPILNEHWQCSRNPILASRVQELIYEIQFGELKTEWIKWWNNNSGTLKEGVVLLGRIVDPEFNLSQLENLVKPIVNEIWIELSAKLTALEKIRIIIYFLYEKHSLNALTNFESKSKHLSIRNLLLTGNGHPLSISLLICLLCRDLSIPVYKSGDGEDPTLAYLDIHNNVVPLIKELSSYQTFFYISPDQSGEIFSKTQYIEYLQMQFPTQKFDFSAISDKLFIRVILQILQNLYKEEKNQKHLSEIKQLLSISIIH